VDDVVRLLSTLVAIPSVNPMKPAPASSDVFEGRLTEFLESWLGALGVECRRQAIAPGRDNLLAWYESPSTCRRILFDVHQDTVPIDGMTVPPFVPSISQGRLYGRGACDVKGSMAAMLLAFARLVKERPIGSASVLLACTVDEEYTHLGSSRLAATGHGADLAIVAEPTCLDLVDCHKGALRFKVRTRGVACHSSTPDRGKNAIYRMARVLEWLERHASELARSRSDPRLGPPTLSVGRIGGGQSVNVVPDRCEIEIDRRVIPGEDVIAWMHELRKSLEQSLAAASWIEFEDPWVDMPPLVAGATGWIEPLRDAISVATGHRPDVLGVPFGTDAGPLSAGGTPCVVFGPGDIAQAHTDDEWIELEQVELAVEAYYRIALALGCVGVDAGISEQERVGRRV
jgi:acetylornithine deacetylase